MTALISGGCLDCSASTEKQQELLTDILSFVGKSTGLRGLSINDGLTRVQQTMDEKYIDILASDLEAVISRTDTEGREFIQVNFISGKKILITSTLIGFKPASLKGLDLSRLPKVVTTPDILSVFEAIQDVLHASDVATTYELNTLKRIYEAVLAGGEGVGFDLSTERSWLERIPTSVRKASA